MSDETILKAMILEEHSKKQAAQIVAWIGQDERRFAALVNLFLTGGNRVAQLAGWPLGDLGSKQPQLFKKHLANIVAGLERPAQHNSVKRNIVRVLQFVEIPEPLHGKLMDVCFRFIEDPKEEVAVKAFSLTVLENLSKAYPEILPELKLVIESRWDYETAAFHSRARKILAGKTKHREND